MRLIPSALLSPHQDGGFGIWRARHIIGISSVLTSKPHGWSRKGEAFSAWPETASCQWVARQEPGPCWAHGQWTGGSVFCGSLRIISHLLCHWQSVEIPSTVTKSPHFIFPSSVLVGCAAASREGRMAAQRTPPSLLSSPLQTFNPHACSWET